MSSALRKNYKDKSFYVVYDVSNKSFLGSVLSSLQGTGIYVTGKDKEEMETKVQVLGTSVKGKADLSALARTANPDRSAFTPKQGTSI